MFMSKEFGIMLGHVSAANLNFSHERTLICCGSVPGAHLSTGLRMNQTKTPLLFHGVVCASLCSLCFKYQLWLPAPSHS